MIPQMTNEQFALWVALKMPLHTRSYTEMAEEYYEWLESKRKKPGLPSLGVDRENRLEQELIKKILDDRSNANGHDADGNPKYIYNGYEYILNESCNKILAMSFNKVK